MSLPCPACGCRSTVGAGAHALRAALLDGDIDTAIALGLLDEHVTCSDCSADCRAAVQAARSERLCALAARDRFRARNARLAAQQRERAERRSATAAAGTPASAGPPPLPAAAAAALARAKAKAAGRGR